MIVVHAGVPTDWQC